MILEEMANPRPTPPESCLVEKNGSVMRDRFSGGMPTPSSCTCRTTLSVDFVPPGGDTNPLSSVRKGLAGVLHQVDDHLFEALKIPFHRGEIFLKLQ